MSAPVNAQVVRDWVSTWNGTGDFNDRYTCTVKDGSGNIYLGGSVTNSDMDRDYLLVKLDANGNELWRQELNGDGNGADEVTAIALDAGGNLLASGFTKSAGNGTDFRTVKYDPNGALLWSMGYNNPLANGYDQANAVAIDAAGNVIVTGQSDGDPGSAQLDDYTTIKYDPVGTELWVVRFDGIGGGTDRATGLGLDALGNIYVTGRTDNGTNDDYATIKYAPSGTQQWLQYADRGGRDRPVALVLDTNANVYVTGRSANPNNDDLWTIKYDNAGNQIWQMPYDFVEDDRAIALAIDGSANVYVTGQSDGDATPFTNLDYACVAYSSAGVQLWAQRFNGSASNDDLPTAVATDGAHVFITGTSDADATANIQNDAVTRSYAASSGTLEWSSISASVGGLDDEARGLLPLANGCLLVGSKSVAPTDHNALALLYNNTGTETWERTASGIGDNNENIRAMATDAVGNIYAAGYTVESRQNRNMALWKWTTGGALGCMRSLNGTSPASPDEAQGIAMSTTNDPVVSGFTKNSGESNNITTFSANANTCDTTWTRMVMTPANGSDKVYDMVRDNAGNFYMTGRIDSDPTFAANDDAWTAKMNASGTVLWSMTYNSGPGREDRGSFVRVAPSGNVYITGRTWNGADFDVLTIKYNGGGAQQWAQVYSGGNGDDQPYGLAIDGNENVLLTGSTAVAGDTTFDVVTLKYTSTGVQQWSQLYNGSGGGDDQAAALAVDVGGSAFVAATSDVDPSPSNDLQMLVVCYDPSGVQQWVQAYGAAGADDHADDIAVNDLGQPYVTGHTNSGTNADPNYDVTTVIYSHFGPQLWFDTYNAPGDTSDVPARILISGNRFHVGGYSATSATMRDALMIQYSGTIVGIKESGLTAGGVFPSPFSDQLNVTATSKGRIDLFDATGRLALTSPVIGGLNTLPTEGLANGLYTYKLTTGQAVPATGRVIHQH